MDKELLIKMLIMQKNFQKRFNLDPPLKDIAQALANEAGELWKAGGGKWWSERKYSRAEKAVEIIDILHFFLAACLNIELTPDEIFKVYIKKLTENYQRQLKKGGYKG